MRLSNASVELLIFVVYEIGIVIISELQAGFGLLWAVAGGVLFILSIPFNDNFSVGKDTKNERNGKIYFRHCRVQVSS